MDREHSAVLNIKENLTLFACAQPLFQAATEFSVKEARKFKRFGVANQRKIEESYIIKFLENLERFEPQNCQKRLEWQTKIKDILKAKEKRKVAMSIAPLTKPSSGPRAFDGVKHQGKFNPFRMCSAALPGGH